MRLACWPFEVEGQGDGDAQPPELTQQAEPAQTRTRDGGTEEAGGSAVPADHPGATAATTPGTSAQQPAAPPQPATGAKESPPTPPPPALPASLPLFEEARYEIRFGILGAVGELRFSARGVATAPDGSRVVHLHGSGEGGVLGLGSMQRRIESEFDAGTLASRSWSVLRLRRGQKESEGTLDSASRGEAGSLHLQRLQAGQPLAQQTVTFAVPTFDPLGLLWRLRTSPPPVGGSETLQVLDGLALWRLRVSNVSATGVAPAAPAGTLRLEGDITPILYDGAPDTDRPTRRFTLWLSDDANHLPLRLEVPIGIGAVVMTLAEARKLASRDQPIVPLPGARNL